MAKKLQLRRGTTSQHSSFTGAEGEVTVDTDKDVVVVHDGSTAGGTPLATEASVTAKQAADAELTELATMASGTASALADLTQTEVQILDGATVTTAELNILDGVTSTAAELNILDGVTSTAAELNILDGVTSTTAELNILDGVTSTAAELNKLDGFTGDKDDLNYAKDLKATGVTSTEFDYLDGVTSNIQTQLGTKAPSATPTFSGTVTSGGDVLVGGTSAFANNSVTIDDGGYLFCNRSSGAALVIQQDGDGTSGDNKISLGVDGSATFKDDVSIDVDDKKLKIGAGPDLELYHNGNHSYISDTGTGSLVLSTSSLKVVSATSSENMIEAVEDAEVNLYHNNSKKFETTSSGVKVTGAAVPASITGLTDGATIAVDFSSNNNYSVTLAGNRTLGQPSNQTAGQSGSIFVTQDGTGSRTLAYHADWKWAGGTAPTLSTAANAVDRIDYIVAAANKVHAVASLAVA